MNKNKNPLYVVKGDQVEKANNFFDLIIKKLNLQPAFELLMNLLKIIIENIKSYAALEIAVNFLEEITKRFEFFKNYKIV